MNCQKHNRLTIKGQIRAMGFSLVEVLVTIVILMIGLLGLAGLQSRAYTTQLESYQRSQALILLKDMAGRIESNRKNAAAYITSSPLGVGGTCPSGTSVAQKDLCAWHNALLGSAEVGSAGAMIGARGCVLQEIAPALGVAGTLQVVVSWQGLNSTAAPGGTAAASPGKCGFGMYTDRSGAVNEALHRVIAIPVSIADLQ
ncbi:MAG: type IV pilus modification protein PilV [Gallionella sp.]|nr:type IV pilus modification protein PilV [Gallionella sp.]